jgi:hypothetical protein
VSYADPTEEELEARHNAMAGGCHLVPASGHCDDLDSVVLWGKQWIGFNDWSEGGGHWGEEGEAELTLPEVDRERIWHLLVEAGRKLREIEAIGEEWRERLVTEAKLKSADRDPHRFRRPQAL